MASRFHGLVVEEKAVAVAAEDERNVEGFGVGVAEGLLHARADGVVVVLRLDDGDGDVGLVVEDVVSALLSHRVHGFCPEHRCGRR